MISLSVHVVATYFREFRLSYYSTFGTEALPARMLDERRDWTSDLVRYGSKAPGISVDTAIINDPVSQCRWASAQARWLASDLRRFVDAKLRAMESGTEKEWYWHQHERPMAMELAFARIYKQRPNVVLFTNTFCPSPAFRQRVQDLSIRVVVQCTQPLQDLSILFPHDLVMTVSPAVLNRYRAGGMNASLFHYGFDPEILAFLETEKPVSESPHVVFVGQVAEKHVERRRILAALAQRVPVRWYGPAQSLEIVDAKVADSYCGEAFGMAMYRALRRGTVGWNHPPDFEPALWGTFRTYEILGLGLPMVAPRSILASAPKRFEELFMAYEGPREAVAACEKLITTPEASRDLGKRGQEWILAHRSSPVVVHEFLEEITRGLEL